MTCRRGLFILFEGLDGTGKTTHAKLLTEFLNQKTPTKYINFPNRSLPSGVLINKYLKKEIDLSDEEIHKLFSLNRREYEPEIIRDLNSGITLVCDRYIYSGVAYSAAKGLDFHWCQSTDAGLILPDIIVFLYTTSNITTMDWKTERYETVLFQEKVYEQYQKMITGDWIQIDTSKTIDQVQQEVVFAIEERIRSIS